MREREFAVPRLEGRSSAMSLYVAIAAGLWLLPVVLVLIGYGFAAVCSPARRWILRQLLG